MDDPESQSQSQNGLELEPPSLKKSDRSRQRSRRRRRSSARFLRLTGRLMEDIDEEEEEEENVESEQNLGDMYKRAIRMNAENRINASNSWNLRLIENIDKFLEEDDSPESPTLDDDDEDENQDPADVDQETPKQRKGNKEKRVNFTKASCTLDASVKIYSYRVDDVHLTSYKVLANLNRTENNEGNGKKTKKKDTQSQGEGGEDTLIDDDDDDEGSTKTPYKNANTLETNVANINMNKLDSAFDIDPLFHKMSKTFDEGGAKGLLLVNLGVGDKGCNIVFDSKAECEEEVIEPEAKDDAEPERDEGMVDISSLLSKLDSIEAIHPIDSMSMVPQLRSLRDQYAQLNDEGFVEKRKKASKRYASTQAEENEADKSIHEEAIERSRASIGVLGRSFASQDDGNDDDDDAPMFAPDDFGGGGDDYGDDDDDDAGFDAFIALDNNGARFSSISFRNSLASTPEHDKSQADVLLDAICSGGVLGGGGEYEFFDTQALEMSMSENQWAGSQHFSQSHWKRSEPVRKRQEKAKAKKSTRTKKTKKKSGSCIDLTAKPVLEDILRKPPKGKRGSTPLQMSKTMIVSKSKEDNLLPFDTGVGLDKLSSLFLRPAVVRPASEKPSAKNKTVCFDSAVETFGGDFDLGGDDDFGGDDDGGAGFAFADDGGDDNPVHDQEEFVIEELKGVRKVDTKSVRVGYATIAKKVDVRRLKRDLWTGIESSLPANPEGEDVSTEEEDEMDAPTEDSTMDGVSFQDIVREMEESKSQADATLPFYFICLLHLANEKGLRLSALPSSSPSSSQLEDFFISNDPTASPAV